jgi:hypothetical protein
MVHFCDLLWHSGDRGGPGAASVVYCDGELRLRLETLRCLDFYGGDLGFRSRH